MIISTKLKIIKYLTAKKSVHIPHEISSGTNGSTYKSADFADIMHVEKSKSPANFHPNRQCP